MHRKWWVETRNNIFSTTESLLWRKGIKSAYMLQVNMVKNNKMCCTFLWLTFWMSLI